jgi:putative endonuclease
MKDKYQHLQTGSQGESIADAFLTAQGYQILFRNWRSGKAEIDLIASNGDTIHFVEVKTRTASGFGLPEHRVNKAKLRQMRNGARAWLEQFPQWKFIQFDIVSIYLDTDGEAADIFLISDIS